MSYIRGHKGDFDRWEKVGLAGWSQAHVLPYFKRLEAMSGEPGPWRGRQGPVRLSLSAAADPIYDAFLAGGQELGYPLIDDYNGPEQRGFARMQHMARDGRRSSAAAAYLAPASSRPNLRILTRAQAARILVRAGRALGIECVSMGKTMTFAAAGEVILSGGAFNSPQLLLSSGIGPAEELKPLGITPLLDLPGVGRNLQDHPQLSIGFGIQRESRMQRQLRVDRLAISLLQAQMFGTGFAAEPLGGVTAFVDSAPGQPIPDIELFCVPSSLAAREWFPVVRPPAPDGITLKACLLRPKARGHVSLASADPLAQPRILTNFLSEPDDLNALRNAVRLCRDLAATQAFRPIIGAELLASATAKSDAELDAYIRAGVETIYHPCGTCRMGSDEESVVSLDFRLRGMDNLRVIDASVMPDHIGATINAAVMMLAEKAADVIRGRPPLPPEYA